MNNRAEAISNGYHESKWCYAVVNHVTYLTFSMHLAYRYSFIECRMKSVVFISFSLSSCVQCTYANRRTLLCIWTLNSKHMTVKLIVKKDRSNYCFRMKRIIDGHRFTVSLTSEFTLFVENSNFMNRRKHNKIKDYHKSQMSWSQLPLRWIVCTGRIWSWVKPRSDGPFKNDITSSGVYAVFSIPVSSIDNIWSPTDNAPHLFERTIYLLSIQGSFC